RACVGNKRVQNHSRRRSWYPETFLHVRDLLHKNRKPGKKEQEHKSLREQPTLPRPFEHLSRSERKREPVEILRDDDEEAVNVRVEQKGARQDVSSERKGAATFEHFYKEVD